MSATQAVLVKPALYLETMTSVSHSEELVREFSKVRERLADATELKTA